MDYNKDRWGFKFWNDETFDEEHNDTMTSDVLKNRKGENDDKGENARIYFQNIGIISAKQK